MSKATTTELAEVAAPINAISLLSRPANKEVPDFIAEVQDHGTSELRKYITPPRLKVIQGQRTEKYKDFNPGELVLAPQAMLFARNEEPFYFIPLLFYPEWATANPWALKDQLPMFVKGSRTRDPASDVARRARDADLRDADKCLDPAGNPKLDSKGKECYLKHIEFLTYVIVIVGHPEYTGMMVTVSFAKGEHKVGSSFGLKVDARGCAMWGCIFEGRVPKTERRNSEGAWFGIDVDNPSSPDVPKFVQNRDEFAALTKMHDELVIQAKLDQLRPDLADEEDFAPAGANETQF